LLHNVKKTEQLQSNVTIEHFAATLKNAWD